jgi:large subunit ribosomal protein L15
MQLHDICQGITKRKKRKRIGRGIGSGHGKTSTKGHKGHSSRQGFKRSPLMEGGQTRLALKIPKRGFSNAPFAKVFVIFNLDQIEAKYSAGEVVDEATLRAKGMLKGELADGVKILGDGELTKSLTVRVQRFSESARAKIVAAGGKAETV